MTDELMVESIEIFEKAECRDCGATKRALRPQQESVEAWAVEHVMKSAHVVDVNVTRVVGLIDADGQRARASREPTH